LDFFAGFPELSLERGHLALVFGCPSSNITLELGQVLVTGNVDLGLESQRVV
jgi:hypothetical protein